MGSRMLLRAIVFAINLFYSGSIEHNAASHPSASFVSLFAIFPQPAQQRLLQLSGMFLVLGTLRSDPEHRAGSGADAP